MAELKTKPLKISVTKFLNAVEPDQKRKDAKDVLKLMKDITGEKAVMWGETMVGFGKYQYKYASGQEGEWFVTGFAPRKQNLTLYIMPGFSQYDRLLKQLGKHKLGRSCLYINKLADVDLEVLKKLVSLSVEFMKKKYPGS